MSTARRLYKRERSITSRNISATTHLLFVVVGPVANIERKLHPVDNDYELFQLGSVWAFVFNYTCVHVHVNQQ